MQHVLSQTSDLVDLVVAEHQDVLLFHLLEHLLDDDLKDITELALHQTRVTSAGGHDTPDRPGILCRPRDHVTAAR